jgi:glyoxylase-like metal-dependent hydrolase (beta-lactamase superfamily II)
VLFEAVDKYLTRGNRLAAVVLTHHHADHVGAATACAERYGVPVLAHPWTAEKLHGKVAVTCLVREGDHLPLGPAPDGDGTWHLEALHTPGHARGHLAFYEPHYRLLFAGDMVSTLTSVVIAPPEGDLTHYLESLQRMRSYDSHAPPGTRQPFGPANLGHRRVPATSRSARKGTSRGPARGTAHCA